MPSRNRTTTAATAPTDATAAAVNATPVENAAPRKAAPKKAAARKAAATTATEALPAKKATARKAAETTATEALPAKKATARKAGATAATEGSPAKKAAAKKAAKAAGTVAEAAVAVVAAGPDLEQTRRARRILKLLTTRYPDPVLELDFESPLQLLVAAVLAAQTLDERVNLVTPVLFAKYPTAADLAAADPADMEEILQPVGYFRKKTQIVMKLAATLVERHDGEVPKTLDELIELPWVGRKTANMVLGNAFATPAISVDTHVGRVAHRLAWGPEKDVEKTETDVAALFEQKDWVPVNLLLILHGRRTCHSRKPACGACPLAEECPSAGLGGKGELDPEKARALLK
ncbi:endonuclease III [Dactylosporangium sp. NPDC000521]|uniref:endonuclease III n=1 Tax=Dactylosporangium sp. NPDC000521 TaxID=3363975 RepID=UPI00368D67C1